MNQVTHWISGTIRHRRYGIWKRASIHSSSLLNCGLSIIALLYVLSAINAPAHAKFECAFTVTNIVFGSVDVGTGLAVDSSATLNVQCIEGNENQTNRMCVSIDGGSAWDGTSRFMNGSSAPQLRYQLYSNAARTTAWGSWPNGLYGGGFTWDIYSPTKHFSATMTVYGRVLAAQQSIPPGDYISKLILFSSYAKDNSKPCPDNGDGNVTISFLATATVLPACIVSANNLSFGNAGSLANNVDATTSISVQCSNGLPYEVGLNAGNGAGATVSDRKMTLGGASVSYALYSNSTRTMNWGNTAGTDAVGGIGTGAVQSLTVYGRVPSQSTPAPGTYNDTIVVTVTY